MSEEYYTIDVNGTICALANRHLEMHIQSKGVIVQARYSQS